MGLEPTTSAVTEQRSTIKLQTPKGERRVELRTYSLQNYRSTIELLTQKQKTSRIGLEPTTSRLTVARSTIKLPKQKIEEGGTRTHTKNFGDSRSTIKLPPRKQQYPLSDLNRHSKKK